MDEPQVDGDDVSPGALSAADVAELWDPACGGGGGGGRGGDAWGERAAACGECGFVLLPVPGVAEGGVRGQRGRAAGDAGRGAGGGAICTAPAASGVGGVGD